MAQPVTTLGYMHSLISASQGTNRALDLSQRVTTLPAQSEVGRPSARAATDNTRTAPLSTGRQATHTQLQPTNTQTVPPSPLHVTTPAPSVHKESFHSSFPVVAQVRSHSITQHVGTKLGVPLALADSRPSCSTGHLTTRPTQPTVLQTFRQATATSHTQPVPKANSTQAPTRETQKTSASVQQLRPDQIEAKLDTEITVPLECWLVGVV